MESIRKNIPVLLLEWVSSVSPVSYTHLTTTNQDNDTLMNINENIKILIEYLSDPRNRQAVISNDLLQKHNEEINMINRLKRL